MIVYLLLNTVNNKCYVGKHHRTNLSDRWSRADVIMLRAKKQALRLYYFCDRIRKGDLK